MKIYDSATDVIHKALCGMGLAPSAAAEKAGLDPAMVVRELRAGAGGPWMAQLAPVLGLEPSALVAMDQPWVDVELPPAVRQIVVPFEEDTVNLWLIEGAGGKLLIDAGFEPEDYRDALGEIAGFDLFITHPHRDHIGALSEATCHATRAYAPAALPGCETLLPGTAIESGPWRVLAHDLGGHHPQSLGYRIQGDGIDILAVGDALYACSMGGCASPKSFQQARDTLMAAWPTLQPGTLILPGHGPATTVERESACNPFIAGWLGE